MAVPKKIWVYNKFNQSLAINLCLLQWVVVVVEILYKNYLWCNADMMYGYDRCEILVDVWYTMVIDYRRYEIYGILYSYFLLGIPEI